MVHRGLRDDSVPANPPPGVPPACALCEWLSRLCPPPRSLGSSVSPATPAPPSVAPTARLPLSTPRRRPRRQPRAHRQHVLPATTATPAPQRHPHAARPPGARHVLRLAPAAILGRFTSSLAAELRALLISPQISPNPPSRRSLRAPSALPAPQHISPSASARSPAVLCPIAGRRTILRAASCRRSSSSLFDSSQSPCPPDIHARAVSPPPHPSSPTLLSAPPQT